jgi:hypothetical protein
VAPKPVARPGTLNTGATGVLGATGAAATTGAAGAAGLLGAAGSALQSPKGVPITGANGQTYYLQGASPNVLSQLRPGTAVSQATLTQGALSPGNLKQNAISPNLFQNPRPSPLGSVLNTPLTANAGSPLSITSNIRPGIGAPLAPLQLPAPLNLPATGPNGLPYVNNFVFNFNTSKNPFGQQQQLLQQQGDGYDADQQVHEHVTHHHFEDGQKDYDEPGEPFRDEGEEGYSEPPRDGNYDGPSTLSNNQLRPFLLGDEESDPSEKVQWGKPTHHGSPYYSNNGGSPYSNDASHIIHQEIRKENDKDGSRINSGANASPYGSYENYRNHQNTYMGPPTGCKTSYTVTAPGEDAASHSYDTTTTNLPSTYESDGASVTPSCDSHNCQDTYHGPPSPNLLADDANGGGCNNDVHVDVYHEDTTNADSHPMNDQFDTAPTHGQPPSRVIDDDTCDGAAPEPEAVTAVSDVDGCEGKASSCYHQHQHDHAHHHDDSSLTYVHAHHHHHHHHHSHDHIHHQCVPSCIVKGANNGGKDAKDAKSQGNTTLATNDTQGFLNATSSSSPFASNTSSNSTAAKTGSSNSTTTTAKSSSNHKPSGTATTEGTKSHSIEKTSAPSNNSSTKTSTPPSATSDKKANNSSKVVFSSIDQICDFLVGNVKSAKGENTTSNTTAKTGERKQCVRCCKGASRR